MADFRRMAYTNPLRSSSPTCRARAKPLLAQDVAVQRCADKPFHAQDARIEVVAVGSVSAGAGFSGGVWPFPAILGLALLPLAERVVPTWVFTRDAFCRTKPNSQF